MENIRAMLGDLVDAGEVQRREVERQRKADDA
jgi:hypothetical protein